MDQPERQAGIGETAVGFTDAFAGLAGVYAKSRPAYPREAVIQLAEDAGLEPGGGGLTVDVGTGTGIFARCLTEAGLRVVGIEPDDDMRAQAEAVLAGQPLFSVKNGTAESTGLPEGCADLVTTAQAFHWFDKPAFRAECLRILKPDAPVAVVWNRRIPGEALLDETAALHRRYCPAFESLDRGVNGSEAWYPRFFRDGVYAVRRFPNELYWDEETFVGRACSSSFSLRPEDPGFEAYIGALRGLFARHARDSKVRIANETFYCIGKV